MCWYHRLSHWVDHSSEIILFLGVLGLGVVGNPWKVWPRPLPAALPTGPPCFPAPKAKLRIQEINSQSAFIIFL